MSKLTSFFSKMKDVNDEMFLNSEKITIMNGNKILIQNYEEILELNDELIKLKKLTIKGKNLQIKTISKYFLEITGTIIDVHLGSDLSDG